MENIFKQNSIFRNVYVKGEVSGKYISSRGHLYFTLKDKQSKVPCIVYEWFRGNIGFEIENGMKLLVTANVVVYSPHGKYQLDIRSATDDGLGRLFIAYKQLKKKLSKEGLFEDKYKKNLPEFPKKIGVVTSKGGSVIHDIIKTVEKQWPYCEVLLFPAAVQGSNSKKELVAQIKRADDFGLDVMIVARGGGSLEELQSYNEETVVRTIFQCKTPVISAVGHEDDVTLCDLVADRRASTPTMAASLAVQNRRDVQNHINHLNSRLLTFIFTRLESDRKELENMLSNPLFVDSTFIYSGLEMHFENLCNRFDNVSKDMLNSNRFMLNKIKQEYVIRYPCKMQLNNKKSNLNELKTRLINAMDLIINNQKVNLDKATNIFKVQSEKLLTNKRHSLEMSKSYLKTNPCQSKVKHSREELNQNKDKVLREIRLKLEDDQKEFNHVLNKSVFKNPDLIYSNKSKDFIMLNERFLNKSNELLVEKRHMVNSIKNTSIIRNPKSIYLKKRDDLNKLVDGFTTKSKEITLTCSYQLHSIKNSHAIKNQLKDYISTNENHLQELDLKAKKYFRAKINDDKKDFNVILNRKLFKNPEILYESKYDEFKKITSNKIIRNPYLLLNDYKSELKLYEDKLEKINQLIMLKKEQQKQKRNYTIIILFIVIVLVLIIIFGGIL